MVLKDTELVRISRQFHEKLVSMSPSPDHPTECDWTSGKERQNCQLVDTSVLPVERIGRGGNSSYPVLSSRRYGWDGEVNTHRRRIILCHLLKTHLTNNSTSFMANVNDNSSSNDYFVYDGYTSVHFLPRECRLYIPFPLLWLFRSPSILPATFMEALERLLNTFQYSVLNSFRRWGMSWDIISWWKKMTQISAARVRGYV
jgi:hypothetical protein